MAIQRLLNQTVNRCIHTQAALHKTHKWAFVWIDNSHRGRDYNNTLTPKHNQVCLQPHLDVADKTLHQRFYFILFFKENENLPNFIESCFILLSCGTVWKPELIRPLWYYQNDWKNISKSASWATVYL